jgi:hypothetical protein
MACSNIERALPRLLPAATIFRIWSPSRSLRCNRYQASGLVANHVSQGGCAEHAPQRSVEQNGKLRVGARGADGLIIFQRIDDAVACESVDDHPPDCERALGMAKKA